MSNFFALLGKASHLDGFLVFMFNSRIEQEKKTILIKKKLLPGQENFYIGMGKLL